MDEKSKDTAAGGTVGALIGGAIGGPVGAAIGGAGGALLGSHEDDHPALVRDTYYELVDATGEGARIYVDHVDVDGAAGHPDGVISDLEMIPDIIVVQQYGANLVIEAETVAGINDDPDHAVDQLNDFQTSGFKRLLVGPRDEAEAIYDWAEQVEDDGHVKKEIEIATPGAVSEFV